MRFNVEVLTRFACGDTSRGDSVEAVGFSSWYDLLFRFLLSQISNHLRRSRVMLTKPLDTVV
jgi:hypothetical protein